MNKTTDSTNGQEVMVWEATGIIWSIVWHGPYHQHGQPNGQHNPDHWSTLTQSKWEKKKKIGIKLVNDPW